MKNTKKRNVSATTQTGLTILKVEYVKRQSDGKYIEWSLVPDTPNIYRFKDELGKERQITPVKWIITNMLEQIPVANGV